MTAPESQTTSNLHQGSDIGLPSEEGLAGALVRGAAAMVTLTEDGTLVEARKLADAWGTTPQALDEAIRCGHVFAIEVRNKRFYPAAFLALNRALVAQVCQALGVLTASEKLIFWLRSHGALAGKTVSEALEADVRVERIEQLANAWALERGEPVGGQQA